MYQIKQDCCINCGTCAGACPVDAIQCDNNRYVITDDCVYCGTCASLCPCDAVDYN